MTTSSAFQSHPGSSDSRLLTAAVAVYLGRYRGQSRIHTDSDLKVFLRWSATQALDPLQAARTDIERYVRWLQDVRLYQPSTVSRRLSVVIGFYRVCVIDEILPHSPADYVRRPLVPPESPTLGLSHLQFEAMITAVRLSVNINDFAMVAMLGLLARPAVRSRSDPRYRHAASGETARRRPARSHNRPARPAPARPPGLATGSHR